MKTRKSVFCVVVLCALNAVVGQWVLPNATYFNDLQYHFAKGKDEKQDLMSLMVSCPNEVMPTTCLY